MPSEPASNTPPSSADREAVMERVRQLAELSKHGPYGPALLRVLSLAEQATSLQAQYQRDCEALLEARDAAEARVLAALPVVEAERDRSYQTINEIEGLLTGYGIAICSPLSDAVLEVLVERDRATERESRLRAALGEIRDELGVPDTGYPVPVANAVEIAGAALDETASTPRKEKPNG
jgi:Lon protease-like protein